MPDQRLFLDMNETATVNRKTTNNKIPAQKKLIQKKTLLTLFIGVTLFGLHVVLLFSGWTELEAVVKYRLSNFIHVVLFVHCTVRCVCLR